MTGHSLPDSRIPVLLSAHEEELVSQDAAAVLRYLDNEPSVAGVAATLLRTRRFRQYRAVVRAADRTELAAGLQALAEGNEHPLVARSSGNAAMRIAFVFPGQGNQWSSMGAEAYCRLSAYRAEADRCAEVFAAAQLPSPLPYLLNDTEQDWSQIHIQGAQFTHAVSLAQVWRSCGVLPGITVGHSLGEVAAAYVAGAITLPDAVAVVAARAAVVDRLTGRYGMAVLGIGVEEAQRLIAEIPGWLEVSAVNAPSLTVISGDRDAVAACVELIDQRGAFAHKISVDYPGHTSALEPLRGALQELLPAAAFMDTPVEFIGSAHGSTVAADTGFADYWYDNLRNTVRFDKAVAAALQRGANAFIELSAHPSLLYPLADLTENESVLLLGSGHRDECVTDQLAANIAAAAVANPGYRWRDVAGVSNVPALPRFPNAPMRAVYLWAKRETLPPAPGVAVTVASEEWEPHTEATSSTATTHGVAVIGPQLAEQALTRRLTEAIASHPGCHPSSPAAAEIVVMIAPALEHPDVMGATNDIISQAEAWLPHYAAAVGSHCRQVWLFTAGGEQVGPDDPIALPAQAALTAMHRSIGFEFPDQVFAHLDLPSRTIGAEAALTAVDALFSTAVEVALRASDSGTSRPSGLRPYTRRLRERRETAVERPLDAVALDSVLITGGSGTVGLHYARHCVEHGARRIILLSRKGVDQAVLDRLVARNVDGHSVEVIAPTCDITDPDAVSAAAAQYAGEGASLLIHAAGVARFGPHDQLKNTDLTAVFGAKLAGLTHLVEIWPLRPDCRMLLCSSLSGVWGGFGHAAYAAANRMLDVLAAQLRSRGLDCVAMRFGLWQGTAIADADDIAGIERSGLVAMDPDAAINASLRHHIGDPLILAADFDRLRVFFESQGTPMPFTVPLAVPNRVPKLDDPADRSVPELVRAELTAVLSLGNPASVNLEASLTDVGVDSLLALDLRTRLRRRTGRSVALAKLLGGMTGSELIDALQSDSGSGPATSERLETSERVGSSRD